MFGRDQGNLSAAVLAVDGEIPIKSENVVVRQ